MFGGAILIALLSCVLLFVAWCIEQRRKFRGIAHIPGPKPLPIVGNALEFGSDPVAKLQRLVEIQDTFGSVSRVWIGPSRLYLLISDPELMEFFLSSSSHITKSFDYNLFHSWLGLGLLTSTGSYWHKKRKIMTPAFHFKILEEFFPVFNSLGDILLQRLSKKSGEGIFDISPYVTAYTLDTICETAMGTSVNAQKGGKNEYVQAVEEMRNIFIERAFSAWKQIQTLYEYSKDYQKEQKALDIIHGFTRSVITKKKQQLIAENGNSEIQKSEHDEDIGIKKRIAFLDLLLRSTIDGRALTDEEIREEVDTFMFEGHDTTASAIGFALHEIANNPDVQNKIVEELNLIYGDGKSRSPTYQDLQEMKYMENVIKEVLRLYPSVPIMGRELKEDANYKGTIFPKGLNIIMFSYYMHRREELYPDANTFNPDRFLAEDVRKKNAYMYIPFSAGPRNCIGQKFAMFEMKTILSKILLQFELASAGPEYAINKLSGEVILKSENGIMISLRNRCKL